ncbi:hypothetical protein H7U20_18560, partial [Rugamonas sp. CCM 8940]
LQRDEMESRDQALLSAIKLQIQDMTVAGNIKSFDQIETFEGFGSAVGAARLGKGMEAPMSARASMLNGAIADAQALIAAEKVVAQVSGASTTVVGGNSATRPTWRQSEIDVGNDLGAQYNAQQSFKNGQPVPQGTLGSVRPDFVAIDGTASFEVKNYNIQTNSYNLINNVSSQAIERAANLPVGMAQEVIICLDSCDYAPFRSWPLFKARHVLSTLIHPNDSHQTL